MLKKICDKCGQELNQEPYYDIDAQNYGAFVKANSYYHYDLCENCMIEVDNFIKGKSR